MVVTLTAAVLTGALLAACGSGGGGGGGADGKAISIALSNSYNGNTFRQQMQKDFQAAAEKAKTAGQVSKYEVVDATNSANDQIAQIQSMILQGYKAIVVDAASSTALNGVIGKACAAGVTVVSFDTLVTAPCAYKVETSYEASGEVSAKAALASVGGKGNALVIRGLQGSPIDQQIYAGQQKVLAQNPNVKVVGTVYGSWSNPATQQAVQGILSSTPNVDVVLNQGDEGQGAVRAFQLSNRPVPPVMFGNTGVELATWTDLLKSNPKYETVSIDSSPGMSTVAMWVAYEVAQHAQVPKRITLPMIEITEQTLPAWLKAVPQNGIATKVYSREDTKAIIDKNKAHTIAQFDTAPPSS